MGGEYLGKDLNLEKESIMDFPRGPVVKTLPSTAGGVGSTPGWGTEAPHAMRYSQKLKSRIQFKVFWRTTQRQGTRMDGPLVWGQEGPAEPL